MVGIVDADNTQLPEGIEAAEITQTHGDWARRYASLGWRICRLAPRSKMPNKGSKGWRDATTNKVTIEAWWAEEPDANIAVAPTTSRQIVLDIDYRHGGKGFVKVLEQAHGAEMANWHIVRCGDGMHIHWAEPVADADIGALQNLQMPKDGQCGIDLFGLTLKTGFVVVPPSVHPSGARYEWQGGLTPWDRPLSPFTVRIANTIQTYLASNQDNESSTTPTIGATNNHRTGSLARNPKIAGELEVSTRDSEAESAQLAEYDKDPRFVAAVCTLIGIPFKPNKSLSE